MIIFPLTKTIKIAENLYKNEKIKTKFDNMFYANTQFGYSSGFYVLNETINQYFFY